MQKIATAPLQVAERREIESRRRAGGNGGVIIATPTVIGHSRRNQPFADFS
jgi:hypothetical protein